jgi:Tol biopolymer transport system component
MRRTAIMLTLGVVMLAPLGAVQDPDVRLQKAIQQEITSGDLRAAIAEYRRIAEDPRSARDVRARALLRTADAHRKLGDSEARKIYQQIVSEFGDQKAAANEARNRLAGDSVSRIAAAGRAARQLWVGADGMGSASMDGRLLSFTDWETGDLAVRDLLNETTRRLTNTGGWEKNGDYAEFSTLSADGRQVAYAWYSARDNQQTAYSLRLLSVGSSAGVAPRILHREDRTKWVQPFAFTNDGRSVIFLRQLPDLTHEIASIGVDGSSLRVIKQVGLVFPTKVSLSPDGGYLAYDLPSGGLSAARDITVLRLADGQETAIVRHHANDYGPLWAPDGTSILFISDRTGGGSLWMQPVREGVPAGEPRLITVEVQDSPIGISRAGALLYGKGGNFRNVYWAALDAQMKVTGEPTLVTERFLNTNRAASWSPDGRRVAMYTAQGRGPEGPGSTSVAVVDLESKEHRVFTLPILVPGGAAGLAWFPDAQALLVVGRGIDEPILTFHRLDLTNGQIQQLHRTRVAGTATSRPSLSPDGAAVFYIDSLRGDRNRSLMRLDVRTGQVTEFKAGRWFGSISVSPDGGRLAYIEQPEGDGPPRGRLIVAPVAGGEERVLFDAPWVDGTRIGTLTWSPDGKYVFFVRADQKSERQMLFRVPSAGGEPQETGISTPGTLKNPDVHPDGRRIAYTTTQRVPSELWVFENFLPSVADKK